MRRAGSSKHRDIDDVEPAQDAVDDRPQDRVVVGIGDRDGEGRAKTHAIFRALDPHAVGSISVHGDPRGLKPSHLFEARAYSLNRAIGKGPAIGTVRWAANVAR